LDKKINEDERIALVTTIYCEILGILVEHSNTEVVLKYPIRVVMNGFYPVSFFKPDDKFAIGTDQILRVEIGHKEYTDLYRNIRLRMQSIKEGVFDLAFAQVPVKGSA